MKNIFNIFKTDLNNIRKNKAAIVVIVALMILPSMYAWFNIIPSWDPYANTEDISVAVANLDEGTKVEDEKVNVGDNVIDSLKDNNTLGWKFVDKDEALKGVEKGDYYASIIIPADFSQKLTSVLDEVPEKPILDYYINEKINAIAPKVTNAGASGIVESIQSGFVKVANEAIFTAFNDVGIELEANQKAIERFRDSMYRLEDDLPEIERLLDVADEDLVLVEKAIVRANDGLVKAEEISKEAKQMSNKLEETLEKGDQTVQKYIPIVKDDLHSTQEAIQKIPNITDQIAGKGDDIDEVLDKITDGTDKIDDGTEALDKLIELLQETNKTLTEERQLEDLIEQLQKESNKLSELQRNIEIAIDNLEKENPIDKDTTDKIGELADEIGKTNYEDNGVQEKIDDLQATAKNTAKLTDNSIEFPQHSDDTLNSLNDTLKQIEIGQEAIQSLINLSEQLQESFDDGIFLSEVDRVESLQVELQNFKDKILQSIEKGKDTKVIVGETLNDVKETSIQLDGLIDDMTLFIDQEFLPKYNDASNKANAALKEGNNTLDKIISYFPTAYKLLDKVDDGVHKGQDGLEKTHEIFPELKEKVVDISSRIRTLEKQGDLDQVIKLMKNDPIAEGDFFSDPILLNEHELFPIPNYGSAMAPFFTAMSLWVGGLILVSSLIVDIPNKRQYKSYEAYFGRFLTFWMIGLAQSLIVTAGNIFLLKTFVAHKLMFILFGFLISTTFIIIVYTLVSVFGNTGKVIAIVLLVMQLGASGGTFPIQMTPVFFQKIHAFLPFTHALGLFREAVGGIIWSVALKHIAWLLGYMGLFLFIGIKLKERINKSSDKFLEDARKSEVIL